MTRYRIETRFRYWTILLPLVSGSFVVAAPVSVACNSAPGTLPTYSNSSDGLSASCSGLSNFDLQGGNASASLSFGLDSDGWYALRTTTQTLVSSGRETLPGGTIPIGNGSAETHIHWSETFNTGDPVRPGYLYLQLDAHGARSYNADAPDSLETIVEGLANGTATSPASTLNACLGDIGTVPTLPGTFCNPGIGYFQAFGGYPVPVLLGTDMTLLVDADFMAHASGYTGIASGQGSSSYRFRLTELDGSPVSLIAIPEPSTFAMLGAALLLFAPVRCRVFRRRLAGL